MAWTKKDKSNRSPDGLITVTSSGSAWQALVEAKILKAKLDNQQPVRPVWIAKMGDLGTRTEKAYESTQAVVGDILETEEPPLTAGQN